MIACYFQFNCVVKHERTIPILIWSVNQLCPWYLEIVDTAKKCYTEQSKSEYEDDKSGENNASIRFCFKDFILVCFFAFSFFGGCCYAAKSQVSPLSRKKVFSVPMRHSNEAITHILLRSLIITWG